ncbi:hypothetical protein Hanom_Chr05g00466701 [Helianthus anomalus]
MTNMLMVTTTMGMLNWIHSNTTNLGPAVSLHTELVICITSFKHRLLGPTTSGNLTNHGSASARHNFLGSRWKLDPKKSTISSVSVMINTTSFRYIKLQHILYIS